jgi:murein DD-endopeptidase MepM/ murein hydrolase activator NlpD
MRRKTSKAPQTIYRFPLDKRPRWGYISGGRYFGAKRKGGRLHAGCDLLAPEGTEIYAIADGKVKAHYPFYSGTDAVEVEHTGGFIVRYGEISKLAPGVKVGSEVKRGQHIAYVGKLNSGSSMLHFELYSGSESGKLTNRRNKPYQRRSDLVNPSSYLDNAVMK